MIASEPPRSHKPRWRFPGQEEGSVAPKGVLAHRYLGRSPAGCDVLSDGDSDASVSGEEDDPSAPPPAPWFMAAMDREVHPEEEGEEGAADPDDATAALRHNLAENWLRALEAEAGQPGPAAGGERRLARRVPGAGIGASYFFKIPRIVVVHGFQHLRPRRQFGREVGVWDTGFT